MSDMESGENASVGPVTENQDTNVQETEQSDVDVSDGGESDETENLDEADEGSQKRPGKIQRKMSWLEAQLAAKDRELSKFRNQGSAQERSDEPQRPKMEDFDDVMDYIAADRDYAVQQALRNQSKNQEQSQVEQEEQAYIQAKQSDYNKRLVTEVGNNQELIQNIQAMDASGLITPAIERSVYESSIGEKITVHLAENPDVVIALSQLPEHQQWRAMGAIEACVANQAKVQKSAPPQEERQTQAIPPINPPKSQAAKNSTPLWDLSQADYEKKMAQMRKR